MIMHEVEVWQLAFFEHAILKVYHQSIMQSDDRMPSMKEKATTTMLPMQGSRKGLIGTGEGGSVEGANKIDGSDGKCC